MTQEPTRQSQVQTRLQKERGSLMNEKGPARGRPFWQKLANAESPTTEEEPGLEASVAAAGKAAIKIQVGGFRNSLLAELSEWLPLGSPRSRARDQDSAASPCLGEPRKHKKERGRQPKQGEAGVREGHSVEGTTLSPAGGRGQPVQDARVRVLAADSTADPLGR